MIKVGRRKSEVGSEAKQESALSLTDINAAFSADNCYITDGPALWWERNGKEIIFHARSNKDMGGGFRYIPSAFDLTPVGQAYVKAGLVYNFK